jgi:hypothetical protein
MKHCSMSPTYITNDYRLGKSKETAMHHVITHIQEEVENSVA